MECVHLVINAFFLYVVGFEIVQVTERARFQCERCDKSYKHKRNLLRHAKFECQKIKFFCLICEKSYTQQHWLRYHIEKAHPDANLAY